MTDYRGLLGGPNPHIRTEDVPGNTNEGPATQRFYEMFRNLGGPDPSAESIETADVPDGTSEDPGAAGTDAGRLSEAFTRFCGGAGMFTSVFEIKIPAIPEPVRRVAGLQQTAARLLMAKGHSLFPFLSRLNMRRRVTAVQALDAHTPMTDSLFAGFLMHPIEIGEQIKADPDLSAIFTEAVASARSNLTDRNESWESFVSELKRAEG